jgi:hypothetical protein
MPNKMYRTALGKQVDMGALLSKNETVRAVGNMSVNARGDVLDKKNSTVTTKAAVVNAQYRKQIRNQVEDVPVGTVITKDETELEIEGFDTPLIPQTVEDTTEDSTPVKKSGGLASAIAKAREVEQKKIETPREKSRGKKGVKKI